MILNWGQFYPSLPPSPEDIWQCLETFCLAWGWRCCLSLGCKKPGLLLNIRYFTGQPLQQGSIRPNMSTGPRVGDPILCKSRDSLWRQAFPCDGYDVIAGYLWSFLVVIIWPSKEKKRKRTRQPNDTLYYCLGAVLVLYFNSLTFKNCYAAENNYVLLTVETESIFPSILF